MDSLYIDNINMTVAVDYVWTRYIHPHIQRQIRQANNFNKASQTTRLINDYSQPTQIAETFFNQNNDRDWTPNQSLENVLQMRNVELLVRFFSVWNAICIMSFIWTRYRHTQKPSLIRVTIAFDQTRHFQWIASVFIVSCNCSWRQKIGSSFISVIHQI